MKARAGWREKNELEITGKDGKLVASTSYSVQILTPEDAKLL